MSAFSDEIKAVALDLLTEFGEAITFTRVTEGAYNPATLTTATGSTTTFSGYGVPTNYGTREVDLEIVQQSDIKLYVNATSTEPAVGDTVSIDSKDYRVLNIIKYAINSENVLYELQLRV